jgi:hypothetical protein
MSVIMSITPSPLGSKCKPSKKLAQLGSAQLATSEILDSFLTTRRYNAFRMSIYYSTSVSYSGGPGDRVS